MVLSKRSSKVKKKKFPLGNEEVMGPLGVGHFQLSGISRSHIAEAAI